MAKQVAKRGQKTCPKCSSVCGVRSRACPKCSFTFPIKGEQAPASKVHKTRKARKVAEPAVQSGASLISTLGLITSLKALAADLGGVEKATALIDRVDALVDQAGGVEALKESLQIVAGVPAPVVVEATAPVVVTPAPAAAKKGSKKTTAPAAATEPAPAPKAEALAAEEAAPGEAKVA